MRLFSKFSFLFLFVAILFASCDRENLDNTTTPDPGFEPEVVVVNNLIAALQTTTNEGLELGCFSIDFPFELLLEDGSTIEITSIEEFEAAGDPEAGLVIVDFVFPLNVTTEDGESVQVNDNMELGMQFASCIPDDGWDDTETEDGTLLIPAFLFEELCFDLIYPVDLQDIDGNAYVATNEAELVDLIITVPSLSFTLPMTVTDEDGEEVVIESVAGFYDLYYECDGIVPPGTEGGTTIDLDELGDCYLADLTIEFPYTVITDDGETIIIEDANQEADLILSGVHYTIEYPFNLVDADGGLIAVNSEQEFIELLLPCIITIEPTEPCDGDAHIVLFFNAHNIFTVFECPFDINYPVEVTVDGAPVTLNSVEDYYAETGAPFSFVGEVELVYPITVTVQEDGSMVELNSDDDLCEFITSCE